MEETWKQKQISFFVFLNVHFKKTFRLNKCSGVKAQYFPLKCSGTEDKVAENGDTKYAKLVL